MNDLVGRLKIVLLYIILCIILLQAAFLQLIDSKDPSFQIISLNRDLDRSFETVPLIKYSDDLTHSDSANPLPTSSDSHLYMKWVIPEDNADLMRLTEHLAELRKFSSVVNLSVMPADRMSDEDYIAFVSEIDRVLKDKNLLNVHLITYPKNRRTLSLFYKKEIWRIGVTLEQAEDLKWLDVVYKASGSKSSLFIEDHIQSFYSGDIPKGVKAVYEVYYTLALKYPRIKTVLMPYAKELPVTQYTSVYASIADEVKNSPTLLHRDSKLSGEQKLILWSDYQFFTSTAYVHYKWNDSEALEKGHYPYPVMLDTTALPNGLNRLKLIGYDKDNSVLWRKTLDMEIVNVPDVQKAPRVSASYTRDKEPFYKTNSIPVLMYHSFSDKIAKESENSYVEIELFEKQLQALVENNYTPISFYELYQYEEGLAGLPDKPIIITADDGYLDNYTLAYPLLQKYNMPATFFISAAYVGVKTANDHFTWEDALEMEQSGLIDIQIHGYDHTPFTDLSKLDLKYQVSISRGLIEKHLGPRDVVVVSYPQFRHTKSTQALLTKMSVDFQITNLTTQRGTVLQRLSSTLETAMGTVLQNSRSTPETALGTVLQNDRSTPETTAGTVLQNSRSAKGTVLQRDSIRRINVPNTMSPEELISTLEDLTN